VADRAATANLYSHYANRRPFGVLFTAFPFFCLLLSLGSLLERGVVQTKRGCLYLSLKVDRDEKQQERLSLTTTLQPSFLLAFLSHSRNPVASLFFGISREDRTNLGGKEHKREES
jgi:hypothetical protein